MKQKEILTYIVTIAANIILGILFSFIIFNNLNNFIFVDITIILLSLAAVFLIAKRLDYKLDIYAYNIVDEKYLIINSIFIGELFSIPLAVFITALF